MDIRALIRRLGFVSAMLLAAKIATFQGRLEFATPRTPMVL